MRSLALSGLPSRNAMDARRVPNAPGPTIPLVLDCTFAPDWLSWPIVDPGSKKHLISGRPGTRMCWPSRSLKALHQVGNSNLKGIGEGLERLQRHVRLTAFNLSDVRPVQARPVRQHILGPAALRP